MLPCWLWMSFISYKNLVGSVWLKKICILIFRCLLTASTLYHRCYPFAIVCIACACIRYQQSWTRFHQVSKIVCCIYESEYDNDSIPYPEMRLEREKNQSLCIKSTIKKTLIQGYRFYMVSRTGFEPVIQPWEGCGLTACRTRHVCLLGYYSIISFWKQ